MKCFFSRLPVSDNNNAGQYLAAENDNFQMCTFLDKTEGKLGGKTRREE